MKLIVGYGVCRDTEYWTGWVTQVEYYEDWKETVHYTETYTDSEGNSHIRHRTRTDYHPPKWIARESNGFDFSISQSDYERFRLRFNNERFIDLSRSYCCFDDGDMYCSSWTGQDNSMEVVTTTHSYQNRVANSNSVFNYEKVDAEALGLFEYPNIRGWNCASILGNGGPTQSRANRLLDLWNAKLGAQKEVRVWILVFNGQTLDAGYAQECHWKGSNKNELVLCVGVDGENRLQWGHVFSWTEREDLKVGLRNYVNGLSGKPLDLVEVVGWIGPNVQQNWQRKDWSQFDYISVEPPTWTIVLTFCLTLALNIGLSWWLIVNEHSEYSPSRGRRGYGGSFGRGY
jgi:hypothetical protein